MLLVPLLASALIVGGQAILPAVMGLLTITIVPFCTSRQNVDPHRGGGPHRVSGNCWPSATL
ncbi:MAG: hypothetical protein V9G09_04740 [Candidatus Nanopelagicales bacterium]